MGEYADIAIEEGMDSWYEDRNEYGNYAISQKNPTHYHDYYDGISIVATTEKAYLIAFKDGNKCWVAKKLCKKVEATSVYIWERAKLTPINKKGD